ncbi:AraC family transcriptional regulator ligand-binding domain-containing protein [Amycolatopsis sp. PS_44_ISF1]|uniref:AraC family transcriptional regulator n=1 Tax=Amycolatopsis sp. PS_44_ISF1 TaxID=2974917 RepID=UPI0028DEC41B|nr:AraC family transcriptional regulator ligand-binding domain-containing protein [Amycolatopsis sp. PS_44_ISF1]MDT8916138.1 AraC family transcriptional regulator [Amycolatopsis sp. PS_44_ISF1]
MAELAAPAVHDWDFPRGTASIRLMLRFAEDHGVPARELRSAAGLDDPGGPGRADAPDRPVDARHELAVVRAVAARAGDSDELALDLGRRYRVTTFGIFGFACISSPTMRDAMLFALRYLDLSFTFCIPHVELGEHGISLVLDDTRVPADVARFLVLRDLAAIHTVMRDLLPQVRLQRLALRHPAPPSVQSYVDAFGLVPSFGAASHRAELDPALLTLPLPQANEQTVALCVAQCDALVAHRRERSGLSQLVRERLVRLGGVDAGLDEVARQLAVSPRTLRRRLADAGTGYRQLVDEVRRALAEEMLDTGALSVEDVALRLGYAEASSFIHAFKRWTGMTPAAFARRSSPRARPGR